MVKKFKEFEMNEGVRLINKQLMYEEVGDELESLIEHVMRVFNVSKAAALANISYLTDYIDSYSYNINNKEK